MQDDFFSKLGNIIADGLMYLTIGIFLIVLGFYLFDKHKDLTEPVTIYRETIDQCIKECSTNKNLWSITVQDQMVSCRCLNNANFYMKNK